MATSKGINPLESWYESSIGSPSTADEVYGYWVFVLGIVAGFLGLTLVIVSNSPGDTIRGVGIALAALGVILLLIGPTIRLPLKTSATTLAYIGAAVSVLAVGWFFAAFNAGNWGAAFANSETIIIGLYGLGILVVATGSVLTPLVRRPHSEQQAAEARAGEAEAKRDAAMKEINRQEREDGREQQAAERRAGEAEAKRDAAMNELERQDEENEREQQAAERRAGEAEAKRDAAMSEIDRQDEENEREQQAAETRAGEAEAKRDAAMSEIDRQEEHDEQTASEAEHQTLVTELGLLKESQSQFELYTDQGEKYRWRLRHDNGNIIADSAQGYASRQGAQRGLSAVKRDAFGAAVLDLDKMDTESEDDAESEDDVESDDPPAVVEQNGTQATFETYEDMGGKYRWRLRHDNDNIIADSGQGYASKASRDDGLESIRHYVQSADYLHIDPAAFELYRDEGGEYRWRLLHENGHILADSGQGYASRQGARQGVDSVQKTVAPDGNAAFEVYEDSAGEYRFRLVHDNDNIIADGGQGYTSESSAHDAVDRIREYAPEAHVLDIGSATFEIYEDEGGDWRWRLRHRNGNIMADGSQGYASRTGAEDGLNSVKQNALDAEIEAVES